MIDGIVSENKMMGIGSVPVRSYRSATPSNLTIVFAHGGGFSWGTLDDYDQIARNLCAATGRELISVNYRLAPEHPFPAGLDDFCGVLRNVLSNTSTRVIIGGDSAGGCLAAGAAQHMRDECVARIAGQLLIYPMIEYHDRTPDEFHSLSDRFHPSFEAVRKAWDDYLQLEGDELPNYAVPTRMVSFEGLPPALTILAENDPLRFEAVAYAEAMSAAGVANRTLSYGGTFHGFLNETPGGVVTQALSDISAWVTSL